MILFFKSSNGSPVFSLLQHQQQPLQVHLWGIFYFIFFFRAALAVGIWKCSEFLHLRPQTQALMDVMFPPEVFAYGSHYPFELIPPLHIVLLCNGLVVLCRIDLYTYCGDRLID